MSQAREIAYDAYVRVMHHRADPDEAVDALATQSDNKPLRRLDRNFIKEILFGSLRWHSKIFWILQKTSSRDLDTTSPEVRAALVCGTYQIFYMDRVPDRAAVNESAEYVRRKGQAPAVSFVNGILRQIARRAQYFAKPDKTTHSVDYLALQFAHPKWLVARWFDQFKFERVEKMLAANNQPPPWTGRVNGLKTLLADVVSLQQLLLKEEKTHSDRRPLRSALHFKEAPNLEAGSLFQRGYYTIQDEASQLIALLVDPQPGDTIVDAAAGPGGKLTHIAELGQGKIALTAVERDPNQMARAKGTAARVGIEDISWVEQDFLSFKPSNRPNKIMIDAPCSGLGVLRRHPEGKWLKQESLIKEMSVQQRKLLTHGLELLAPGGELIYSVCSFEPEETADHVAWLKDTYGDRIEMISPVSRLPDYYKRYVTRQNILLIYAGNSDDMDGFGAFLLRLK